MTGLLLYAPRELVERLTPQTHPGGSYVVETGYPCLCCSRWNAKASRPNWSALPD